MNPLFAALLSLTLFACLEDPIETQHTANPNFNVSLLFEFDGCKVYRFVDSRAVYFTKCGSTHTTYTVRHGKTTHTYNQDNINLDPQPPECVCPEKDP